MPPSGIWRSLSRDHPAKRRKNTVGTHSETKRRTLFGHDKAGSAKPPEIVQRKGPARVEAGAEAAQASQPVLLRLPAHRAQPPLPRDLLPERRYDDLRAIPQRPHERLGPQGVHGPAIRAPEPLHPQRKTKPLEVPLNKAVPPQPRTPAARAPRRPGPAIRFACLG